MDTKQNSSQRVVKYQDEKLTVAQLTERYELGELQQVASKKIWLHWILATLITAFGITLIITIATVWLDPDKIIKFFTLLDQVKTAPDVPHGFLAILSLLAWMVTNQYAMLITTLIVLLFFGEKNFSYALYVYEHGYILLKNQTVQWIVFKNEIGEFVDALSHTVFWCNTKQYVLQYFKVPLPNTTWTFTPTDKTDSSQHKLTSWFAPPYVPTHLEQVIKANKLGTPLHEAEKRANQLLLVWGFGVWITTAGIVVTLRHIIATTLGEVGFLAPIFLLGITMLCIGLIILYILKLANTKAYVCTDGLLLFKGKAKVVAALHWNEITQNQYQEDIISHNGHDYKVPTIVGQYFKRWQHLDKITV